MHWGKAGWEKWANCFDGSVEYGTSWCNFGCAVKVTSSHLLWLHIASSSSSSFFFGMLCVETAVAAFSHHVADKSYKVRNADRKTVEQHKMVPSSLLTR